METEIDNSEMLERVAKVTERGYRAAKHLLESGLSESLPNAQSLWVEFRGMFSMLTNDEKSLIYDFMSRSLQSTTTGLRPTVAQMVIDEIEAFEEQFCAKSDRCSWEFAVRWALNDFVEEWKAVKTANMHIHIMQREAKYAAEKAEAAAKELAERTCPVCGKVTGSKGAMTRHLYDVHKCYNMDDAVKMSAEAKKVA